MTIHLSFRRSALASATALVAVLGAAGFVPTAQAQAPSTEAKSAPTPEVTDATDAATKSATTWLQLTDGGKYVESWDAASKGFQGAVPRSDWATQIAAVRAPMGVPTARTLKSAKLTRELPNAPPGDYVVIQFDTAFEKRPGSVETVVAVRDPDQAWRVTGYFVK